MKCLLKSSKHLLIGQITMVNDRNIVMMENEHTFRIPRYRSAIGQQ